MAPTDDEIRVLLTAEADKFKEGMEAAATSVEETTDAMKAKTAEEAAAFNAAVQAKIDAMTRLNAAFASGLVNGDALKEAELALDEAMNAGALTASEYGGYVAKLDAAELAMAGSVAKSTEAIGANTEATLINGGVAREVGVLVGEMARGNYTRMEGSLITLANRTGTLSGALGMILSPLGLVGVAVAAAGYEAFKAGQKFESMEGTVLATGGAAGYTAGQLTGMADQIGAHTGNIKDATEAVQKLAESGRFAGHDLGLVARAAADMAALTGESIQSAVGQIDRLQEDPVKAVAKLNDQFHFLTVTQFKEIEAAQDAGDNMKAASIAYEAMAAKMEGRTDKLNEHVNILIRSWRELRQTWDGGMRELDHALGGGPRDGSYELNEAKEMLTYLQEQKKTAEAMGSSALPGIELRLQHQQQVVAKLTQQFQATADAAAKVGQAAQQSAAQIDLMAAKHHKSRTPPDDRQATQGDMEAYKVQQLNGGMSLHQETAYWQTILAISTDGTERYRQAINQLLELKNKAASEGAAAARKVAEEDKRAAEESASMHAEVVKELQKEAAEHERVQQITEASSENHAERQIQLAQQIAEDQYRNGQLTAQQLIAVETSYVNQRYQLKLDELKKEQELHAQEPVALANIQAQVLAAVDKHNADLQRVQEQFQKTSESQWKQYAQRIEGSVTGAINGIIFQHETLRNAAAQVAESMATTFIAQEVRTLVFHEGAEQAKTAATIQASLERDMVETAAAIKSVALSAETAIKQIMMAGWQVIANTWSAISAIPMVGPFLAPALAIGAGAEVFNLASNVASAAGGWDRVPVDGAMTELHKDEMVLPAHIANPMRDMATKGRMGGGDNHYHHYNIQAWDSQSIRDMLRRNPHLFAEAAQHAKRRGY